MTSIPTRINNRQIHYLDILDKLDYLSAMTLKIWILLVIEHDMTNPILLYLAALCIEKDVIYVCSAVDELLVK